MGVQPLVFSVFRRTASLYGTSMCISLCISCCDRPPRERRARRPTGGPTAIDLGGWVLVVADGGGARGPGLGVVVAEQVPELVLQGADGVQVQPLLRTCDAPALDDLALVGLQLADHFD